jgi:hypothetical protein
MKYDTVTATNGKIIYCTDVSSDGTYEVRLKKCTNIRSHQQNKYYWGVVIPYLKDFFLSLGVKYTNDEAHVQFKDLAGWYTETKIMQISKEGSEIWRTVKTYRSFSDIGCVSTVDFCHAVDTVRLAIEHVSKGMYSIPLPNNGEYDFYTR